MAELSFAIFQRLPIQRRGQERSRINFLDAHLVIDGNIDQGQDDYTRNPIMRPIEMPLSPAPGINIENIGEKRCDRYYKGRFDLQDISEAVPLKDKACCCDQAHLGLVGKLHGVCVLGLKVNKLLEKGLFGPARCQRIISQASFRWEKRNLLK